jgi:hypothetical protein
VKRNKRRRYGAAILLTAAVSRFRPIKLRLEKFLFN